MSSMYTKQNLHLLSRASCSITSSCDIGELQPWLDLEQDLLIFCIAMGFRHKLLVKDKPSSFRIVFPAGPRWLPLCPARQAKNGHRPACQWDTPCLSSVLRVQSLHLSESLAAGNANWMVPGIVCGTANLYDIRVFEVFSYDECGCQRQRSGFRHGTGASD